MRTLLLGFVAGLVGGVAGLTVYSAKRWAKHWWDGYRGLDQWPNPHGRYYSEWLKLPEGAGDYYAWLARRMDDREPWITWARLDAWEHDQGS